VAEIQGGKERRIKRRIKKKGKEVMPGPGEIRVYITKGPLGIRGKKCGKGGKCGKRKLSYNLFLKG